MNKIKKIIPIVLAMVMVFGGCLTAHAYTGTEELPIYGSGFELNTLPDTVKQNQLDKYYVIYRTTAGEIWFVSSGTMYVTSSSLKGTEFWYIHKMIDGVWQTTGQSGADLWIELSSIEELLYTSHDIYRGEDVFFRHPSLLGEVEIRTIPQTVTEQTKIILITAVCCLALLISLHLFPRVLHKFL